MTMESGMFKVVRVLPDDWPSRITQDPVTGCWHWKDTFLSWDQARERIAANTSRSTGLDDSGPTRCPITETCVHPLHRPPR